MIFHGPLYLVLRSTLVLLSFVSVFSAISILEPLVSDSHLFVVSPEEYMIQIFWEMTSRIISVFSTLWFDSGYMLVSVFEAFWKYFTLSLREKVDYGS